MSKAKEIAHGMWSNILTSCGLGHITDRKHHPCPMCGGKDRFRWTDYRGDGCYICNQCGRGDGLGLIMKAMGVSYREACEVVEGYLGEGSIVHQAKQKAPAPSLDPDWDPMQRTKLRELWASAHPLYAVRAVEAYLKNRGIALPETTELKAMHRLDYWSNGRTQQFPALLARVSDTEGRMVNIHRTYINKYGDHKASVEAPRKLMKSAWSGGSGGGCIKIMDPSDGVIAVAEGIETALAFHKLTALPVWSCISTGLMLTLQLPGAIKRVSIAADNDQNGAGMAAAWALAARLKKEYPDVRVDISRPCKYGDFADVINDFSMGWEMV